MTRTNLSLLSVWILIAPLEAQVNVPLSADDICPIKVGVQLPQLILEDLNGSAYDLNASIVHEPAVLVFYRGGWCPFCNRQLSQLRLIKDSLDALGIQLIAVSPDGPAKLKETLDEKDLTYRLLSDHTMEASRRLGIAFRLDDATFDRYERKGYDLEGRSGETHHFLPVPSVFLVDTAGIVHFAYVNPNYKVRLEPGLLLAAVKSMLK